MRYRSEIDGLRAVAVLPVILFHAGFATFSGGFVGVDVFFLISGYLITSLLIDEIGRGEFSLGRFYERRARRILPALFFVILCCLPPAYLWLLPGEMKTFAASVVTTVLSLSNLFFMTRVDYFAPRAELYPLLHTWSLSVEEQYYLLFPLLLLRLRRFSYWRTAGVIAALVLLFFTYSEIARQSEPERNFFFSLSRFWEIGIGSLCAFFEKGRQQEADNALAALGLGLILFAIFRFDGEVASPSALTLVPVIGTALILLYAKSGTWVHRLLGLRALVGIGLISYSAYLWHQPLFAFARSASLTEPDRFDMAALALLSLLLAWATWAFIEQPFRRKTAPILRTRSEVFAASGAVAVIFIAIGLAGYFTKGFPSRYGEILDRAELESQLRINFGLGLDCEGAEAGSPLCATHERPDVLLWGDSFAMHLVQGLIASEPDIRLQQHTKSVCAPILGISVLSAAYPEDWAESCIAHNDAALELLSEGGYDLVILTSAFNSILKMDVMDREGRNLGPQSLEVIRDHLLQTVRQIEATGAKVVVVSPTAKSGWDIGQCAVRSVLWQRPETACDFALNTGAVELALMRSAAPLVPVYPLTDDICPGGRCDAIREGVIIYRDDDHLSQQGSAFLGATHGWMARIREMAGK